MKLKSIISKKPKYAQVDAKKSAGVPEGIYIQCPMCKKSIYRADLKANLGVCPSCQYHYPLSARGRINLIVDKGSFVEIDAKLSSGNPLNFPGYEEKLQCYEEKMQQKEAVLCGPAKIMGYKAMLVVMDSGFMMGSMGSVVGEKITRAIEFATFNKLPLLIFTASGGARMQEGIFSLMQMAKTSSAIARHGDAGGLYISILTDPTTGGVTASFATLGDVILAEEGALIGFAGPRVIEQTIKEKLPEGFQRAKHLLEHGQIDAVVDRGSLRGTLATLISFHEKEAN